MAVNNNLYPGVLDTYMPAFLRDDGVCKVYFSLSSYNVKADIKNVQVAVLNQRTNMTMLDENKYPSEVMVTTLKEDKTKKTDDKYYVEIKAEDIRGGEFVIDEFYKVQIRFTGTAAADISMSTPQAIDAWLSANLQYFSEWSTVCLIKSISTPIISIQNFDTLGTEAVLDMSNIKVLGRIDFVDPEEKETLRSYSIKLYDADNNLLIDSGTLYSDNYDPNSFAYNFKYFFENDKSYHFELKYTTQNLYEETNIYNFIAKQNNTVAFSVNKFEITKDTEEGLLNIKIENSSNFTDTLAIVRSSSETNFTIWEDVHTVALKMDKLSYEWKDKTIESGILYKYGVQRRHIENNSQSILIKTGDPVGLIFDHAYLTTDDAQLKIKFDPSISSMKRNLTDTKVDTIGSKYPFITRTGDVDYKTFPLSGLISFLVDENEMFLTREEAYGKENAEAYKNFNETNNISDFNDFLYERKFREKVSQFLSDAAPKLYRSAPEGNILVQLTDVSFTPNTTLGRYIWSFSCTATEIDDCSIENYDKYNIQKVGSEQ